MLTGFAQEQIQSVDTSDIEFLVSQFLKAHLEGCKAAKWAVQSVAVLADLLVDLRHARLLSMLCKHGKVAVATNQNLMLKFLFEPNPWVLLTLNIERRELVDQRQPTECVNLVHYATCLKRVGSLAQQSTKEARMLNSQLEACSESMIAPDRY